MPWLNFGRREVRANPAENPNIPLSSPQALNYLSGDIDTYSGRSVSERTALKYSWVWACIDLISSMIADLPLLVYEDQGPRRERATDHPAYRLLRWEANPQMGLTAFHWMQAMMAHVEAWGNGYSEIERDNAGRPLAFWPLLPHETMAVKRNGLKYVKTPLLPGADRPSGYIVEGAHVLIPPGRYIHFHGPGYDGLTGYSRIDFMRQAVGSGLAMEEFNARFTGKGLTAGHIIFPDGNVSMGEPEAQKLQRMIDTAASGLSVAHRTQVFPKAFKLEKIGIPPKDAQFVEQQDVTGRHVARFFGVPLSYLQDHEKGSSHNSMEQQALQLLHRTLGPRLTSVEQVASITLLNPPRLFAEFLAEKMLRPDAKTLAEVVNLKVNGGTMSINEGRRVNNMNPVDDPLADELWRPVNSFPLSMFSGEIGNGGGEGGGEGDEGEEGGEEGEAVRAVALRAHRGRVEMRALAGRMRWRLARSYRGIFADVAQRFVHREVRRLERLLTRALASPDGFDTAWRRAIADFYGEFRAVIAEAMLPFLLGLDEAIVGALRDAEGIDVPESFDEDRAKRAGKYAELYAGHHVDRSQGIIDDQVKKGQEAGSTAEAIAETLRDMLGEWDEGEAAKIGSEQAIQAASVFARAAMAATGFATFTWVAFGKSCELCNAINGRTVTIGQPYLAAGDTLDPGVEGTKPLTPRRDKKGPPLHGGCDCIEVPG